MYAVTGISGKVGGETARALLGAGQRVRAVLRDPRKADAWERLGCEIALADIDDAAALAEAFGGADGVFVLLPPSFDPAAGFPEARRTVAAIDAALRQARPGKVVCLSTVGAQGAPSNLLTQLSIMERILGVLPMPVAFLRPAWFMENCAWDVAAARQAGVVPSFLQPPDRAVPMVATRDVGRVAARLLRETWTGLRITELEGPRRVTPNDIAAAFARLLGRPVRAEAVPRDTWEALFRSQGMENPEPRMRMLDGFNQGWIRFAGDAMRVERGSVELEDVLEKLVAGGGDAVLTS